MSFEQHGYEIHRSAIDREALGRVASVLGAALDIQGETLSEAILAREATDHSRVYRACISVGSSFEAYRLIASSGVLDIAAKVTGAALHHLHTMPLHIAIQMPGDETYDYRWHQEGAFYPWCRDILNFWFPITSPSTRDGGTMAVLPGSHLRGLREAMTTFGRTGFRQIEPQMDAGEGGDSLAIEIEPGDLCVFSANMIHRSLLNTSAVPRVTGILRVVNMATQPTHRPLYKALAYGE